MNDSDVDSGPVPVSVPQWLTHVWRPAAALISGAGLIFVFPPWNQSLSAWIALVPLLLVVRFSTTRQAFLMGWISGFVFWCGTLAWLIALKDNGGPLALVLPGWLGLSAYCALYTAVFCALVSRLWRGGGSAPGTKNTVMIAGRLLLMAVLWSGLEWIRSNLFTGFSWNHLGVSQCRNIPVLIHSQWGGVYVVSALLIIFNGGWALTAERLGNVFLRRKISRFNLPLLITLAFTAAALITGRSLYLRLNNDMTGWSTAEIAISQPNPPSVFERNEGEYIRVFREYVRHAMFMGASRRPDMMVWPESALYEGWTDDPHLKAFLSELGSNVNCPMLLGTLEQVPAPELSGGPLGPNKLYNSSVLVSTNGVAMQFYRKRHLVPFGEVLPFDKTFPELQRLGPLGVSCWPGEDATVFSLPLKSGGVMRFGVLICFEDSVSYLSRELVNAGAQLLVNQSNDAWFGDSSEQEQHMSQCILRCVENGVGAVRSSSVGISCYISASGMVDRLDDGNGIDTGFSGCGGWSVKLRPDSLKPTLYTRYGDWLFAIPCVFVVIGLFLFWIYESISSGILRRRSGR